jgi:hypothetical protein
MALLRTAAEEQLGLTEAGDDADALRMAVEVRHACETRIHHKCGAARMLASLHFTVA